MNKNLTKAVEQNETLVRFAGLMVALGYVVEWVPERQAIKCVLWQRVGKELLQVHRAVCLSQMSGYAVMYSFDYADHLNAEMRAEMRQMADVSRRKATEPLQ